MKKNDSSFWEHLEADIDNGIRQAKTENRRVRGITVIWHLMLSPMLFFSKSLFISGNILNGRAGLRDAVHRTVLLFAVNARLYEMENGDTTILDRIKKEWLKPGQK